MGSIPLPALNVRPPTDIDPLNNLARLAQIRGAQQALQTGQIQQQGLTQENQLRSLQLQDQQTLRKVSNDPSIDWTKPGAYDQLFQKAAQAGVSPMTLAPIQQHIVEMRKNLAAASKDELQNEITQGDTYRGKLLSIIQEKDPAQKQAQWEQEVSQAEQQGLVKPGTLNRQYPGDDAATQFANHFAQGSVLAKEAVEKQQADARMAAALKPTYDSLRATATDPKATPEARSAAKAAADSIDQAGIMKAVETVKQETPAKVSQAQQIGLAELPIKASTAAAEETARQGVALSPGVTAGKAAQETATTQAKTEVENKQKMTADEARRSDLANNMNENLDRLQDIATRRPELFGPFAGRMTQARQAVGTNDPDVAALQTIKEQMGMAMVGAHAMRNAQHVETAANSIVNSYHNSPQAVMSSIQQARDSLGTFIKDVQGAPVRSQTPATKTPTGPPAGATHKAPGSDGQMHYTNAKGEDLGVVR